MAYPIPTVPYVPVNYSCFSVKFVPRMPPPRNDSTRRVPASSRNRKKKKANIQRGADCSWNWMLFQAWRSTTEFTWCALYLLWVCGLEGWCEHRLPKESLIRVSIAPGWVSQRTRAPEKNTLWDAELPPLQCLASGQHDSCQSQSSQSTAWMKASPLDPDKICGKSLETL